MSVTAPSVVTQWQQSLESGVFFTPRGGGIFLPNSFDVGYARKCALTKLVPVIVCLAVATFSLLSLIGTFGWAFTPAVKVLVSAFGVVIPLFLAAWSGSLLLQDFKTWKEAKALQKETKAIEQQFSDDVAVAFDVHPSDLEAKQKIVDFALKVFALSPSPEIRARALAIFRNTMVGPSRVFLKKDNVLSVLASIRLHDRAFFLRNPQLH